ncbi:hypothetical protein E4U23_008697 [Claviceps purpurea]|nr:hypothetical protein E4U23_008697 [Claviceps purpurea]
MATWNNEFNFHDNNGEIETKPTKSTKASGKSSIPDTYCRVFASLEGSQLPLIVEYKAPHKLKNQAQSAEWEKRAAALASMANVDKDGDVTRTHRQEQNIIAAACRHHPGVCGNGAQRHPIWLHQRGVMHRDAAPRNMMMLYDDRTGRYMVIDLELSDPPIDGGVPEAEAVDVHIEKGKRK